MIEEFELHKDICPKCHGEVLYKWALNGGGIISSSDYVLIADWIYHSPCWDEIEKNYSPESDLPPCPAEKPEL